MKAVIEKIIMLAEQIADSDPVKEELLGAANDLQVLAREVVK
jgi:hypothetical protein